MKYLRILIVLLTLTLVGIGVYYVYIKISSPKSSGTPNATETARPFQDIGDKANNSVVSKFSDYSTQDFKNSGKSMVIQGTYQTLDKKQKEIGGTTYSYVIGIVDAEKTLTRVWLTTSEYEQISSIVPKNVRIGEPVTITLSSNAVNFSTPYETTKN